MSVMVFGLGIMFCLFAMFGLGYYAGVESERERQVQKDKRGGE